MSDLQSYYLCVTIITIFALRAVVQIAKHRTIAKSADDRYMATLSPARSTTIRPGEKPSDAIVRLAKGEDL